MTTHGGYERYRTHDGSRRLHGYDYTQPAAYFVTICTKDRACLFGDVIDGRIRLNAIGRIAEEEWLRSEAMRKEVFLDAHVIMPNHLHGIVVIAPPGTDRPTDPRGYVARVGAGGDKTTTADRSVASNGRSTLRERTPMPKGSPPKSLGALVAGFKSAAIRRINQRRETPGAPVWQRNYHDRIIRDEDEWRRIRRYIEANPGRWREDRHYPDEA